MRSGERGAALLTVLLLVAVISVLAATGLEKLRLATRLATNAGAIAQARAYAQAAETLATVRISDVLGRDATRVTLDGGWSGRPIPLPIPGGTAAARVADGGNCFNLNGLVVRSGPGVFTAYMPAVTQFARLMRLLNISGNADAIAAATADWIDSDDAALAGGAEDGAYAGMQTPYRTAGTLMSDPSELRAILGVTPEVYVKVRPWVCTLPDARPSTINVNTLAPEQAPLLAMLMPDTMNVETARALLLRRPPGGYPSTVDFWRAPALSGVTADPAATAQTDVTTRWFALRVDVALGGVELRETGLIDARTLPARLVSRQWGDTT